MDDELVIVLHIHYLILQDATRDLMSQTLNLSQKLGFFRVASPKAYVLYGTALRSCSSRRGSPYGDQHLNHKF